MLALQHHLKQTEAFIQQNPVTIVLRRAAKTDDGAGGTLTSAPAPIIPQVLRLVGSGLQRSSQSVTRPDGSLVQINANLVGLPDVDIQVDDTFEIDNQWYQVVKVERNPPWRTQAAVMELDNV